MASAAFKYAPQTAASDDLCLLFCIYPSSMLRQQTERGIYSYFTVYHISYSVNFAVRENCHF